MAVAAGLKNRETTRLLNLDIGNTRNLSDDLCHVFAVLLQSLEIVAVELHNHIRPRAYAFLRSFSIGIENERRDLAVLRTPAVMPLAKLHVT
jgi:hypothetical protein